MATQVSDRPATQDRVIVLKSAEETAGELFRCEYIARVVSPAPRDHIHTHQEERLEVVEGTVRCRVAGREYVLERGSVMVIPPGTPHAVWNDDHARLALDFRIPPRDERPGNVPRIHRRSVIGLATELRECARHKRGRAGCIGRW